MPDITIKVRNKIATVEGSPTIVCGNDGYHAIFDLDAEWDDYELLTMRINWTDTFSGQPRHIDVPYILNFAALPVIADAYEVQIGVYAGNLKTSTPARVPCERCITDGGTFHEDPDPQTYAALLELLRSLGGGGATVGDATFWIPDAINIGSVGAATPGNLWNYWQNTDDDAKTETTLTAAVRVDCLLLACVMHREENVSISGSGWTKVVDSVPAVTDGINQWITVWSKQVQAGTHAATVTQAASARMSMKLIALYRASAVTVAANETIASDPYTPPSTTGKRRLYLLSNIWADTSAPQTFAATNTGSLDLRNANEMRFTAFYDYQPELATTPQFDYQFSEFTADKQNAVVLDIIEEV